MTTYHIIECPVHGLHEVIHSTHRRVLTMQETTPEVRLARDDVKCIDEIRQQLEEMQSFWNSDSLLEALEALDRSSAEFRHYVQEVEGL